MVVLVVVEAEDDGHAGGWDLADLRDDAVDQRSGGEVVHQVEQAEAGLVPPDGKARAGGRGHKVFWVEQFIVHKTVHLDLLCELVCHAEEHHWFITTLPAESPVH